MATTNYSLPTLENTALFDLVTDYNALSNATDTALAQVAGLVPTQDITLMQGQVSALQTLTGSQGTQITTLQAQMSTANDNISTLQSGLDTTNNNIGTLQTGLQSTNSTVSQNAKIFKDAFTFTNTNYSASMFGSNFTGRGITVIKNADNTLFNLFGEIILSSGTKVAIPGFSEAHGIKTGVSLPDFANHIFYDSVIGINSTKNIVYGTDFSVGSDGYLYIEATGNSSSPYNNTQYVFINSLKSIGNIIEMDAN